MHRGAGGADAWRRKRWACGLSSRYCEASLRESGAIENEALETEVKPAPNISLSIPANNSIVLSSMRLKSHLVLKMAGVFVAFSRTRCLCILSNLCGFVKLCTSAMRSPLFLPERVPRGFYNRGFPGHLVWPLFLATWFFKPKCSHQYASSPVACVDRVENPPCISRARDCDGAFGLRESHQA